MASTRETFEHFLNEYFKKHGPFKLVEREHGVDVYCGGPAPIVTLPRLKEGNRETMGEYHLDDCTKQIGAALRQSEVSDEAFLAQQMRLVISHLRTAAANIPDRSEYWAQLVGQICQIRKGAN